MLCPPTAMLCTIMLILLCFPLPLIRLNKKGLIAFGVTVLLNHRNRMRFYVCIYSYFYVCFIFFCSCCSRYIWNEANSSELRSAQVPVAFVAQQRPDTTVPQQALHNSAAGPLGFLKTKPFLTGNICLSELLHLLLLLLGASFQSV